MVLRLDGGGEERTVRRGGGAWCRAGLVMSGLIVGTGFVGWLVVMVGAEEVVLGDGRELAETVGGKV